MANREQNPPAVIESLTAEYESRRMIVNEAMDEEIEIVRNIQRIDAELAEEGADVAQLREERAEKVKRLNILKNAWAKLEASFKLKSSF